MTGLHLSHVSRSFGGISALRDVSLSVAAGELTAIIGPNGAGKSTLINVISGEIAPSAGEVAFKGQQIGGRPAYRINRRGLARTFQSGELYTQLTALENVVAAGAARAGPAFAASLWSFPRRQGSRAPLQIQAEKILQLVGLGDRKDDPAAILTAGQQRLLGVARAVATGADWLVLDEPAAGLNAVEKDALVEVIRELSSRGMTIIFVEHDMRVVGGLARRVVVLDQGTLIADGDRPQRRRLGTNENRSARRQRIVGTLRRPHGA
jgi:branched-chain amino acid transport system ATP-binding protein